MLRNPAHDAGVDINRLVGFALQLQQAQVASVQFVKAGWFHEKLLFAEMRPGIGPKKVIPWSIH